MESQTDAISPQTADAEANMRRNLGIDGTSSSNDPLKAARQAIRSQVTAREHTERQLAQAQGTIQDLRTRLRHVHHERETAVAAAQSIMAAKDTAERSVRAVEATLATERATRVRTEGMLRDAEATIRDLRDKLATANQNLRGVQAERAAEREAHQVPDDDVIRSAVSASVPVVAPIRDATVPVVRRPRGRPGKVAAAPEVMATASPMETTAPTLRRPVGRPRKLAVMPSNQPPSKATTTAERPKAAKPVKPVEIADSEPVQWWLPGWRGR
jgi:hypothetical protein